MPRRLRFEGLGLPEKCVVVSHDFFGNPFDWRIHGREEATRLYEGWLSGSVETPDNYPRDAVHVLGRLHNLRGRDLVCACPLDAPCHADVLLRLANE